MRGALQVSAGRIAGWLCALSACAVIAGCSGVDAFTIEDIGADHAPPAASEAGESRPSHIATAPVGSTAGAGRQHLPDAAAFVLKKSCRYQAGSDIAGTLPSGPLFPSAIGVPRPSNSRVKAPIYLVQIGDLRVEHRYDIMSYIGVEQDGALMPNVLLHSDMPGAPPFATASAAIRFTPADCHYVLKRDDGR